MDWIAYCNAIQAEIAEISLKIADHCYFSKFSG